MVIYVLAVLMSALFMGCGSDDGVSSSSGSGSEVYCTETELGYSDVAPTSLMNVHSKNRTYYEQWMKESCQQWVGGECAQWDSGYKLTIRECTEYHKATQCDTVYWLYDQLGDEGYVKGIGEYGGGGWSQTDVDKYIEANPSFKLIDVTLDCR